MLFPDVNILLAALRPDASPTAARTRDWLETTLGGHEQVGLCEFVLASTIRLATNHRVFRTPSSPEQAVEFAESLLRAPAAMTVRPAARHWAIFRDLVTAHGLRGNDIPDAYLASLAMETGATFVTLDRGFARFEGLKLLDPSAGYPQQS